MNSRLKDRKDRTRGNWKDNQRMREDPIGRLKGEDQMLGCLSDHQASVDGPKRRKETRSKLSEPSSVPTVPLPVILFSLRLHFLAHDREQIGPRLGLLQTHLPKADYIALKSLSR